MPNNQILFLYMKAKPKKKRNKIINKIFLYLNIFFSFLLLMSYASVYINPYDFSLLSIFGLFYPFLLFINILFVVFWIFIDKKLLFISLSIIIIGFSHFTDTFQIHFGKKEITENSFKLTSYNVRLFNKYNWLSQDSISYNIIQFLEEQNSDILCIQEFYSDKDNKNLFTDNKIQKFSKSKYSYIEYSQKNGQTYNYGIATYSKLPIINKGVVKYENDYNLCIYTDLQIKQDTIRVYNCHFQSVHLGYDDYSFIDSVSTNNKPRNLSRGTFRILTKFSKAYKKRARQSHILLEHIRTSPYKIIVCGDFNDTPVSYTYRKISTDIDDAYKKSGLGFGNTYVNNFSFFRIDYILHSKSLNTYNFKRTKIILSDHYPISCWFEIQ